MEEPISLIIALEKGRTTEWVLNYSKVVVGDRNTTEGSVHSAKSALS